MNKQIKSTDWKCIWGKYKWHIAPFAFFIVSIIISLIILYDDENKITLSLAILGSGFTIFQFWISEINKKRRMNFNIMLETFNEYIKSIDRFKSYLNLNTSIDNLIDLNDTIYNIKSGLNETISCAESVMHFFNDKSINESFIKLISQLSDFKRFIDEQKGVFDRTKIRNEGAIIDVKIDYVKILSEFIDLLNEEITLNSVTRSKNEINILNVKKEKIQIQIEANKLEVDKTKYNHNINFYESQIDFITKTNNYLCEINKVDIIIRVILRKRLQNSY